VAVAEAAPAAPAAAGDMMRNAQVLLQALAQAQAGGGADTTAGSVGTLAASTEGGAAV
jgi:hypothetical protein